MISALLWVAGGYLFLWFVGRRFRRRSRQQGLELLVVDREELVELLEAREREYAEIREQAAMVRTLHEIKELQEVKEP